MFFFPKRGDNFIISPFFSVDTSCAIIILDCSRLCLYRRFNLSSLLILRSWPLFVWCEIKLELTTYSLGLYYIWLTSGIEANSHKISANHATVSSQSPSTATLDRRVPLTDGLVEQPHMLNSRGVTSGQLITNFMKFTAQNQTKA